MIVCAFSEDFDQTAHPQEGALDLCLLTECHKNSDQTRGYAR